MEYIKLGNAPLSYNDCYEILINNKFIELDDDAMAEVYKSHSFLKEFIKDKVIYGVNTGFGPMAQYKINQEDQVQLQYNLIRSHCSGSGNQVAILNIRALMLARLNTLLLGYSGINPDALILLKEMINREIYPVIYEHGGLGASGDLVQLAHVALALIGEGEVHYKGYIAETTVAFGSEDLKPLAIYIREGLALMNGTSAMCGIGLVNLIHSKNLLKLSIAATSMIVELVESYDDHYSAELNSVKRHPGQNYVANEMKLFLSGSRLIRKREQYLYDKSVSENIINDKVQENYSIRCVPQILGPVADTINYAEQVVINEINSVSDNPIIDYKHKNVFHGGNFHGDYVALEMDKLKTAITKLSMLCERQINFLFNDKLNNKLTPFINSGTLGLNLGMQGVQFTATSTTAENQTLCFPMYVHSIPSNNDNQDIVSMGTNAAQITQKVIFNTYEIISIEFLSVLQAIDYLKLKNTISKCSLDYYSKLRELVPAFEKDTIKYKDQQKIITCLKECI